MAGVVLNAEPSVDHLGHALQRPEVCPIAGGQGTPEEHLDQLALLGSGELGRPPGRGPGPQAFHPLPTVRLVPAEHRTHRCAEGPSDCRQILARLEQPNGLSAAPF